MYRGTMADLSPESEESFWPVVPVAPQGQNFAQLYRGYKKLINNISEKLRKQEVLSLVYQYDLPSWYSEVGPTFEPGYALRVLIQMESMQIFSPTSLAGLVSALEDVGRSDLGNNVKIFEREQDDMLVDPTIEPAGITFQRTTARRSFDTPRRTHQWMFSSVREHRRSLDNLLDQERYNDLRQTSHHMNLFSSTEALSTEAVHNFDRPGSTEPTTSFPVDITTTPQSQDGPLVSMKLIKLSAQALANQTQILRQQLTSTCGMYPDLDRALLQAFFSAQQVCSSLNIATDELKRKIQVEQESAISSKKHFLQVDSRYGLVNKSMSLPHGYPSDYAPQKYYLPVPVVSQRVSTPQESTEGHYHSNPYQGGDYAVLKSPVDDLWRANCRPLSRSQSQPLNHDRAVLERVRRKYQDAVPKRYTPPLSYHTSTYKDESPQTKCYQANRAEQISWSPPNDDMWESRTSQEPPQVLENGYVGYHEHHDSYILSRDRTRFSKDDTDVIVPNRHRKAKVSKSAEDLLHMGERVSKEKSSWTLKLFRRKRASSPRPN